MSTKARAGSIAILAVVWLLLTEAGLSSWIIGIPFIALAIFVMPQRRADDHVPGSIMLSRVPGFFLHFMIESLRGGIDVSRRVLARQPILTPGIFDYPVQLQCTGARRLFITCINLLPGTLCADWYDGVARVHALDKGQTTIDALRVFEHSVSRLYGESP